MSDGVASVDQRRLRRDLNMILHFTLHGGLVCVAAGDLKEGNKVDSAQQCQHPVVIIQARVVDVVYNPRLPAISACHANDELQDGRANEMGNASVGGEEGCSNGLHVVWDLVVEELQLAHVREHLHRILPKGFNEMAQAELNERIRKIWDVKIGWVQGSEGGIITCAMPMILYWGMSHNTLMGTGEMLCSKPFSLIISNLRISTSAATAMPKTVITRPIPSLCSNEKPRSLPVNLRA